MWQPPSAWGRKLGWVQICINSLVEPQTWPLVTGFGCPGLEGERWLLSQKHSSLQSLLFSDITFPAGFLCQAEQQNLQYSCLKESHKVQTSKGNRFPWLLYKCILLVPVLADRWKWSFALQHTKLDSWMYLHRRKCCLPFISSAKWWQNIDYDSATDLSSRKHWLPGLISGWKYHFHIPQWSWGSSCWLQNMFVPCNTPSWIEGKHLGAGQVAGYWKLGLNNSTSPCVCGSQHVQRAGQRAPHPCLQSPVLLDAGARGPCSRKSNDQVSGLQQLYRFVKWGPPSIRSPFVHRPEQ